MAYPVMAGASVRVRATTRTVRREALLIKSYRLTPVRNSHTTWYTLRQRLLRDDHDGAADIWWQWRRGGPARSILPGLVKRREMEKELFLAYSRHNL